MSIDPEWCLYSFAPDGTPVMVWCDTQHLIDIGLASPAAWDMSASEIAHQINNVNGGEVWIGLPHEPGPWVCHRDARPDLPDPHLWRFFADDEKEAQMWLDSGQVDLIHAIATTTEVNQ